MGKNKKKVTHTKKEEEQAKRVIKIISISPVSYTHLTLPTILRV